MKKNKLWLAFCLAGILGHTKCFAQRIEFQEPIKLNDSINSDAEELLPFLCEGGERLYFTRAFHEGNVGGRYAGSDIWTSRYENGSWQAPHNELIPWNNKENNAVIGERKQGDVVYLLNAYKGKKGISFSKNVNGKWSKPETLAIPGLKTDDFVGFYVSPTYDFVLISMNKNGGYGQEDLYVSLKDPSGDWQEPISLGGTINTAGFEISPFLSDDQKYLYFSSDGHDGYGNADIFVSERLYGSWTVWSKPKNLGPIINTSYFDGYFSIYGDTTSFFASNREEGYLDIYTSRVKLNSKNVLQDSVQRIIDETKRLLSDLKKDDEMIQVSSSVLEFLSFDFNSSELDKKLENSLDKVLKRIEKDSIFKA